MHCHLLVPEILARAQTTRLAAAETLIARGRRRRLPRLAPHEWLFARFGVARQRDWPVAPYSLLADGGAPGRDFWLRADPVHLLAGRGDLTLSGTPAVSRAEADALAATLNHHYGESAQFLALRPDRWYLRTAAADAATTTPHAALGKSVGAHLPAGEDAMRLGSLVNEAQMLLHEHPVNREREARGAPAINSVWLWGGGTLAGTPARPFDGVVADDPLARGLALAAGASAQGLPRDAASLLAAADDAGVVLVVPDGDAPALERDWFAPLLAALRSGRIGMLTLHLAGAGAMLEIEIARADLRHFWRLRKPLSVYA